MIDIKLIRDNPDEVKARIKKREMDLDSIVDEIRAVDGERRELLGKVEAMKAEQNAASKQIPQIKKAGGDASEIMAKMKELAAAVKESDKEVAEIDEKMKGLLLSLPNLPDDDVAAGGKEQNVPVRYFGEKPKFDFEMKNHVDLCESLGMIDYERGAKIAGAGSWLYRGWGARMEWALLNFFINEHIKDGFEFILPPHMLGYQCGYVAGQFPKFTDEVYWIKNPTTNEEKFMLPTAETALVNIHRDEILTKDELPRKYIAYTPCYRREAGSYRSEERGMIRGHQFNKVEMVQYTEDDKSDVAFNELVEKAEKVWIPSMEIYKEVSSASNARDYQARRGNIRYRGEDKKMHFAHTLNASGLATSRVIPAIVEQYQNADGSVTVPEVLRPYMGIDVIKPE